MHLGSLSINKTDLAELLINSNPTAPVPAKISKTFISEKLKSKYERQVFIMASRIKDCVGLSSRALSVVARVFPLNFPLTSFSPTLTLNDKMAIG